MEGLIQYIFNILNLKLSKISKDTMHKIMKISKFLKTSNLKNSIASQTIGDLNH